MTGWLVAAYVALLPVQIAVLPQLRFAPSDVFLLGYLLARGTRITWRRSDWTGWHALLLFMLAVGGVVSQLHGQFDTSAVFQKIFGILFLYLGLVVLHDFMNSLDRVRWLLRLLVQAVVLNAVAFLLIMLLQNLHLVAMRNLNLGGARLTGLLVDPNAFGGLLDVAFVLVLVLNHRMALFSPRRKLLIEVALGTAILFTFSRSAWIGFVLALFAGFLLQPGRMAKMIGRAVPYVLVGSTLVAVTVLPSVQRLSSRSDQVVGRVSILQESLGDFFTAPLTGIGLGAANVRHGRIIHNTMMFFLTELGPVGFMALIGLLGFYVLRAYQASQLMPGEDATLPRGLLMAHAAMFGVSIGIEATYQRHWWLLFAAITATYRLVSSPVPERLIPAAPRTSPALRPLLLPGRLALVSASPPSRGGLVETRHREVLRGGMKLTPAAPRTDETRRSTAAGPDRRSYGTAVTEVSEGTRPVSAVTHWGPTSTATSTPQEQLPVLAGHSATADSRSSLLGCVVLGVASWLTAVLAARDVSAHVLGSLAFILVLYLAALGAWRSLHAERTVVRRSSDGKLLAGSVAQVLGATWLAGLTLGAACVIAGWLAPDPLRSGLWVLGVALPFLLVRETGRACASAASLPRVSAANDVLWSGALAIALVIAAVTASGDGWAYVAAWAGAGVLAGLVALAQLRLLPDVAAGSRWLRATLPTRVSGLQSFASAAAPIYLLLLVTPLLSNLGELGILGAACIICAPLLIVVQAISSLLHDRMAVLNVPALRRWAGQLAIVLGALAALWCGVMTAMPSGLGRWLVGDIWSSTGATRIFIALSLVVFASGRGVALALRLRGSSHTPGPAWLAATAVAFVAAMIAIASAGAPAAAAAILVAQIATLAGGLHRLRHLVSVEPGTDGAEGAASGAAGDIYGRATVSSRRTS